MNKNMYIIQGLGESTGCRIMTKIFMKLGCYGTDEHNQPFNPYLNNYNLLERYFNEIKNKVNVDNYVIRFSYPHGSLIINIEKLYNILVNCDYNVYILYTTRSLPAQIISTVKSDHCENNPINKFYQNPFNRSRMAFVDNFKWLNNIIDNDSNMFYKWTIVNINDLVEYPNVHLRYICSVMNIDYPDDFDTSFLRKNINEKRIIEYKDRYL